MVRFVFMLAFFVNFLSATTMQEMEKLNDKEKIVAKGVIIYSKPLEILIDNALVKKHRVVMAAKLFIKKTKSGYRGYMVRGLYDIDEKKPLRYYANRMIMHPPSNLQIELKNITIQGKKITFDLPPYKYKIIDGGKGYINDEVLVGYNKRVKTLHLYGGDIKIY